MPLIIGLSIPILMILFVAASIYLPLLFVHTRPKFNFLYVTGDDYFFGRQYSVENCKLVKKEDNRDYPSYFRRRGEEKLFVHDIVKNESKEIAFEEAQKFNLNSSIKSPDSFEIVYGSKADGVWPLFGFSERDCSTVYIKGHNISRKLNVQLPEHNYNNFRFLGWITDKQLPQ